MGSFDRFIVSTASFVIRYWLAIANVALFIFIFPMFLAPFLLSTGDPALATIAGAFMAAYHPTCHQLPERSLFVFGHQMPVCSRCFAIYASFLAAGLLFYFIKDRLKPFHIFYYVLMCVPMGIDGIAQLFGIPLPRGVGPGLELAWTTLSTNESRLVTGAIFGLGSALFIMPYMQRVFEIEEEEERQRV